MTGPSFVGQPASSIAQAVHDGAATARAVVLAHLARIDDVNAAVGAFRSVRRDAALAEASRIDELDAGARRQLPLAGVPVAIKDNIPVAGDSMRVGSRATPARRAEEDHILVRRLRAAGAIVIGSTNVPELCLWGVSDSAFGVARTPWRPDRTAGGSSGGSAAAVAAAMVPIAHGNDGLGSLRIPAACCGLVGMRPSPGVVPRDVGAHSWFGMVENGALATTTHDAALMLSVLGADPRLARIRLPERRLRIALAMEPPLAGLRIDPVLRAHTREVAEVLAGLGHMVEEVKAPRPAPIPSLAIIGTWCAGARDDVDALTLADSGAWPLLERRTRAHARAGTLARRLGLAAQRHRQRWRGVMDTTLARYDLMLTPTLARPPLAADGWRERGWVANLVANLAYAPYCGPVNFAALPAIALPAGVHPDGTPTSVHFVAQEGGDHLLLGISAQIEAARSWPRHPGSITASFVSDRNHRNRDE